MNRPEIPLGRGTTSALLVLACCLAPSVARSEVELSTEAREILVRREGFVHGVAVGLISTGAVTAGLSAFPLVASADRLSAGDDHALLVGGIQLGVGAFMALAGTAGLIGGSYLSSDYSARMPLDPALRVQWRAARLKGLGLMLAVQGLVNIAVAVPFLVLSDGTLQTLVGDVPLSRAVGQVDLAIGGGYLLAGLALGLTGHIWDPQGVTRLVIAPAPLPGRDGALVALRCVF